MKANVPSWLGFYYIFFWMVFCFIHRPGDALDLPRETALIHQWAEWHQAMDDPLWKWRNFSPREMACQGSGRLLINSVFMGKLQNLREIYDAPITIISGYRTPAYNAQISNKKSKTGAHTHGRAVDIFTRNRERDIPVLLDIAKLCGFTRCGLQITTESYRLHLDDMTGDDGFAVRKDGKGLFCWTYNA